MRFNIIVSLSLLLDLMSAAPVLAAKSTDAKMFKQFKIKAVNLPNQSNMRFNNFYVESFHTGAGLNDMTLSSSRTVPTAYLNGTKLMWNLSSQSTGFIPYTTQFTEVVSYAGWQAPTINAGFGSTYDQFFINATGVQYRPQGSADDFAGWLVCLWWHGSAQLFYKLQGYNDSQPSNCASVNLIPEYDIAR